MKLKRILQKEILWGAVILAILLGRLTNPYFFVSNNIDVILHTTAIFGTLAIAESLVLLVGEIDLSIGISSVVSPALAIYLANWINKLAGGGNMIRGGYVMMSWWVIVALTMLIATVIGFLNGLIVVKGHVPPFVATIGIQYTVSGIGYVVTKGTPLFLTKVEGSAILGGSKFLNFVPLCFVLFLIIAVIFIYLTTCTRFGMRVYATGGSTKSAKLCGIKTDRWKMLMYIIAGALVGFVGLIFISKLQSCDVTQATNYEMTALAIAITAGIELNGGGGRLIDTVKSTLFMAVLSNVMSNIGFLSYHRTFVTGVFIVLFAIIHKLNDSKRLRELNVVEV